MINDVQKANLWKRISAFMFDAILVITVAVGIAYLLSTVLNYDGTIEQRDKLRQEYEVKHGVVFDMSAEDYEKLTEEERQKINDAYAEFASDDVVNQLDIKIVNITLIVIVFSALIPIIIFEFVIPLCFQHGRTLGKKIFGTGVMRVDGVRISVFQLFVRSILGKFTLETMIPVFLILLILFDVMPLACLVGLMVLGMLQVALILFTQLKTPIHDMIAGTVVVDYASQMIFDSPEALLEYKERVHAEAAEKAEYK